MLFLGRHEPRKGLSVLLEAAHLLPADVNLWIAGNGPETDALKDRYRGDQRIQWLGPLTEVEKIRRLRSADAFCVPSLGGESFGLVLLEGMAAGTPVVASDLQAYRMVARDGLDALLVAPGDSDALAKALLSALGRSGDVEQRVAHGHERAAEFAMSKLADAYIARYQRLAR